MAAVKSSTAPQPKDVKDDPAGRRVIIHWSNGHRSELPYQILRGWCPCATCQGHGGRLKWQEVPPVTLYKVEPVGLYAAQFFWSDLHSTGIYRFEFLMELCCCAACSEPRQGKPPVPAAAAGA